MTDRSRWGSGLTVPGWHNLVLSTMGALVLAGAVAGTLLLNRTVEVSRQLSDDIQPARVAAYQLQSALGDQETAIRGYVIAADRRFLDPYYGGKSAEQAAAAALRRLVGGRAKLIADLDAIERASAAWRIGYAEPLIAGVTPGAPSLVTNATAERGKAQFDLLRQLFDTQNADLLAARADTGRELDRVRTWRDLVLSAMVAVFFATAILLGVLVRRAVSRPLAALAAACRRITDGNYDNTIVARGPKDLRDIAIDVEGMRQQIVAELETSQSTALELRRSNAELEQFAYVASHDLQEPLRKVASFCQLLKKRYGDVLDERGVEYVDFAVDGAQRMQVLINDLLSFSRVGRFGALRTAVDLEAALDAALANLGAAIEESGAVIVRAGGQLPTVLGDPTLLAMLWQNLIGNAVKFGRQGVPPRVAIECARGADQQWHITVSDNGIGIPAEFADKVFVIFQRLHGRDEYTGTGIGLALCRKIVEHHGGMIWIDTSYTNGTRLSFTLPASGPASGPVSITEARTASLEGTLQ
jgi:signal transduction histidine kinase